jgi:enoyl-CoA hydratase/carnithine racemase
MSAPASQPDAPLIVERHSAHVATITINRPAARNALSFEFWEHMLVAIADLSNDADLRALVLTGAGGYFSAGGDLKVPPARGAHATAPVARLELAHRALAGLREMRVPIIAAVERGAAGLGWSLALACDMIVATSDTTFAAPFVARGVVPDGGTGWFLVRRLGRYRTAELLFGGASLSAQEAHQLGLVNRVVDPGTALAAALDWAAALPTSSPHAVELTKRLLGEAERSDFAGYLNAEMLTGTLTQLGPEAARARENFRKRD